MRLWSVHPHYFDRQALTACWREGLLAQAVLTGLTSGYRAHPQLQRFRSHGAPLEAIGGFLRAVVDDADARGYHFDRGKISGVAGPLEPIPVTTGQLIYEWTHLLAKLEQRSPAVAAMWRHVSVPEVNPIFTVIDGPIASWERPKR
ncbi:pyrimidine dimer DNA glycosylase/endonuclease V [Parafrigoribacterium mesophilum]|uniref:pyrimidine dimer DNA glycosylase/endonuclease V n=1 Tax=Parafrigoribacterium mesophilum TaxID=433646 RepID=UPI0031FCB8E1